MCLCLYSIFTRKDISVKSAEKSQKKKIVLAETGSHINRLHMKDVFVLTLDLDTLHIMF